MIILAEERGTEQWREAHRNHVCASDSIAILAAPGTKRRAALEERLVLDREGHGLHTDQFPDPWQEQHEVDLKSAIAAYRRLIDPEIQPFGLAAHDELTWLAASPHGLSGRHGCVIFRIRKTLRAYHGREPVNRAERAKAQISMLVVGRAWCDITDFWDGQGVAPDRLARQRLDFDRGWLLSQVFPRLVDLWQRVGDTLAARRSGTISSSGRPSEPGQPPKS